MVTNKMGATHSSVSKLQQLELYLFPSAFAVNFFLAVIIIANNLSIRYFLYTTPMVVQINFLQPTWTTLLWIGSLYAVYATKAILAESPSFRRINYALSLALIGSFILLFSIILSSMRFSVEPSTSPFLNQLSFWASSFGFILSFAGIFPALLMALSQKRSLGKLFLVYLLSLLIPIEILSLMHWIVYPFDVIGNLGFAWYEAFLELQLFYTTYSLIFWLFLASLFSWIWVPLFRRVEKKVRPLVRARLRSILCGSAGSSGVAGQAIQKIASEGGLTERRFPVGRHLPTAVLLASLVIGIFVAYYPYISGRPGLVGADSLGYYYTLIALDGRDLLGAVQLANEINSARVLYHMMLFTLSKVAQLPPNTVIEVVPVLTILANALAVFWFVKTAERDALLASIAAVFSIFSFTTTISIHAGILANWFAVALGFVVFGLVIKLLEKITLKLVLVAVAALMSLFLVHFWTGLFFVAVLASFLALILWERRRFSVKLAVAGIILALGVLIVVFFSGLLSRLLIPYGISNVFTNGVSSEEMILLFGTRLSVLIDSWFLGALANPVIVGLSLIGTIVCFYRRTPLSRLLISWTVVGSLLSLLVSPIGADMNQWLLWRILYLIPFQILAALGLGFIGSKLLDLERNKSDFTVPSKGLSNLKSQNESTGYRDLLVVFYLVTDFMISAVLSLSLPALVSFIFLNYLILTLIIHFEIRTRGYNQILVFMFSFLIVLALLNYTLRSLAPLSVTRFLP